jgi:colicin import membrane protein
MSSSLYQRGPKFFPNLKLIMLDSFQVLSQVLPHLAVIAIICGFIGWSLRGRSQKPAQAKSTRPQPAAEKGSERVKNLETALEKSRASHKALKAEMEALQASSVGKSVLEAAQTELEVARKSLETESKRVSALEAELKKAQDTNKSLNARANSVDKQQKDRSFALENELSKVRQQLAHLQERPDDSEELHAEIARLKESVAVSTRFAGEMRKREAAAVEALEKAQAQLAAATDPARPLAASRKIGPVADSGRIAAAKAEVLRLVEMNKQKAAAAVPANEVTPEPAPEPEPVLAETSKAAEEPTAEKKSAAPNELFALD